MPIKKPGFFNKARSALFPRAFLAGSGVAALWSSTALAQSTFIGEYLPGLRVPSDAVMFALFMGAFSFAMMSATWLIP